jgi:hypothetical protein
MYNLLTRTNVCEHLWNLSFFSLDKVRKYYDVFFGMLTGAGIFCYMLD